MKLTKDTPLNPDDKKGKNRTKLILIVIVAILAICGLIGLLAKCSPSKAPAPVATGEPCLVVPVIDASSDELDAFKKNRLPEYNSLLNEGMSIDPCLLSGRPDPAKLDRDDDYDEGFRNPDHVAVVVGAFQRMGDTPGNTAENVAQRAAAWVSGSNAWYVYQVGGDNRFVLWGKGVEQDTPKPKKPNVIKPKPAALAKVTKTAPKTPPVAPKVVNIPVQPAAPEPSVTKPPVQTPAPSAAVAPPPSKPTPAPSTQAQPSKPTQPAAPATPKVESKPAPKADTKPAPRPSK